MKTRTDRVLDTLLILVLSALLIGHLLNWGRSHSLDAPMFEPQRTEAA